MPDSISSIAGSPGSAVPTQFINTQDNGRSQRPQMAADAAGVGETANRVQGQGKKVENLPNEQGGKIRSEDDKSKALGADQPSLTLKEAEETVKEYINNLPSELEFKFDKDAERLVFKIVNPVTREVVKQYPPEELLKLAKQMRQIASGSADDGFSNGFLIDAKF